MRLLNVKTITFQTFYKPDIPPYIVASHRWTTDEIYLKDIEKQRKQQSKGFQKVLGFCSYISKYHSTIEWLWIDTVCVDQKSSLEVQEAVTSMFRWYAEAELCLAYLNDVSADELKNEHIGHSVWFTRGWTLQELLAPEYVILIPHDWSMGVDKSDLCTTISTRTGIPRDVLLDRARIFETPIKDRVRWAFGRTTTRLEDMAYCILGVCEVSMTLNYGEEETAWRRLEQEVSVQLGQQIKLPRPQTRGGTTRQLSFRPKMPRRLDYVGQDRQSRLRPSAHRESRYYQSRAVSPPRNDEHSRLGDERQPSRQPRYRRPSLEPQLATLLSVSDQDTTRLQQELVESLASSGALDGINVDELTAEQEDALVTKITDAYLDRQRRLVKNVAVAQVQPELANWEEPSEKSLELPEHPSTPSTSLRIKVHPNSRATMSMLSEFKAARLRNRRALDNLDQLRKACSSEQHEPRWRG